MRWPKKDFLSKLTLLQILHSYRKSDSGIAELFSAKDCDIATVFDCRDAFVRVLDCSVATAFEAVLCCRSTDVRSGSLVR